MRGRKGLQFAGRPGAGHINESPVRISGGTSMPGKMLDRREHPSGVEGVDHCLGMADHTGGIGRETPLDLSDYRVFRIDIEIDNGREIQIYSQVSERLSRNFGSLSCLLDVVAPSQAPLRNRGRKAEPVLQAADLSPFLVDSHEEGGC